MILIIAAAIPAFTGTSTNTFSSFDTFILDIFPLLISSLSHTLNSSIVSVVLFPAILSLEEFSFFISSSKRIIASKTSPLVCSNVSLALA